MSPDLKIGTIAALLNSMGISPLVKDSLKIMAKIGVNSAQQLIRREAGRPSGPAAELTDNSLMASLINDSLKLMSVNRSN